jgi:glycosyltransferase involved in cell wall biosynthesis
MVQFKEEKNRPRLSGLVGLRKRWRNIFHPANPVNLGPLLLSFSSLKRAEKLKITGRVDWHGVVRDPFIFYRAANIFVLPSRVEGTPNALLEAMSCGLPVIVSDGAPGPLELIEDGVTGLVVPVNDAAALAAALRRLASDEQLRHRLGMAARARISEYHLPQALVAWESVVGLTC